MTTPTDPATGKPLTTRELIDRCMMPPPRAEAEIMFRDEMDRLAMKASRRLGMLRMKTSPVNVPMPLLVAEKVAEIIKGEPNSTRDEEFMKLLDTLARQEKEIGVREPGLAATIGTISYLIQHLFQHRS